MKFHHITLWLSGTILLFLLLVPSRAPAAGAYTEADLLVDKSLGTLRQFVADPNMQAFRDLARRAQGILVIPQLLRGGLVVGGTGGSGVLFARNMEDQTWKGPAFYMIGSVTFGFQVGAEASQVVMMVMTERGLASLLQSSFKLGADVSMAAGPIGGGAKAATADILAYAKSQGAFGGFTVEGAVLQTRPAWNSSYYGQEATVRQILLSSDISSGHAEAVKTLLAEIGTPVSKTVDY